MKKLNLLFISLVGLLLAGCSVSGSSSLMSDGYVVAPGGGSGGESYDIEGSGGGESSPGAIAGEEPSEGEPKEDEPEPVIEPGQLTCSALDDNHYYDFWKSLSLSTQEGKGIFQSYREDFGFDTFHRLELTVKNGSNISVSIDGTKESAKVDNFNKVYLFPKEDQGKYDVTISYFDKNGTKQTLSKEVTNGEEIDLNEQKDISNYIELMFVIDATGSMGDEMRYIKEEIKDVIAEVKKENENATLSLAVMVYRDTEDEYLTRYSDFSTDIEKQQEFISKQKAGGGGDFEEAVDVALEEAIAKQWSENSTKLLFHVADAPAHDNKVSSWNATAKLAAQKGIKIITVASSGIDKKTEYFFRSQSLLTAGQYVFLTNDSGIGGDHLEATVEEKLTVEYLNKCLVRLINGYATGVMAEPVSYNQQQ